jgi:hypothetical protein
MENIEIIHEMKNIIKYNTNLIKKISQLWPQKNKKYTKNRKYKKNL